MGAASLLGAGISAAGSIFGANESSKAAKAAADAQVQAAQIAQQTQQQYLGAAQNALNPYLNTGQTGATALTNRLPGLSRETALPTAQYTDPSSFYTNPSHISAAPTFTDSSGFNTSAIPTSTSISQQDLENTPGYQFTLAQGLKATQNSAAARGLGVSGAALKGAASYATGLSDQTYNTRFGQQMGANQQNFGQNLASNAQNFGNYSSANNQNFNQILSATNQNYGERLSSNNQNYAQSLGANAQNFGMDQQNFANTQANQTNAYNKLLGVTNVGGSAANALAGGTLSTGAGIAASQTGAGNAQAAGLNAAGQAWSAAGTGVGNAANNAVQTNMLAQYMQAKQAGGMYQPPQTSGSGTLAGLSQPTVGGSYYY